MNAAALVVADDPAAISIAILDQFRGRPEYGACWAGCVESAGITLHARSGKIEAGWPVDEDHLTRDRLITILATHMDDAGQRAAVLAFLEKRS